MNIKRITLLLCTGILAFSCISTVYAEQDALTEPLNQLQKLAQVSNILKLAQDHDGQLGINQLIEQDENWANSTHDRLVFLNDSMQQYFQTLLKTNDTPFTEFILLGSQGETLAAYPLPDAFWQGNTANFINVMADESSFIDELIWDASSRHIQAQISVPIKDDNEEMFGVLIGKVNTHVQAE
jgi:hypothetical protein